MIDATSAPVTSCAIGVDVGGSKIAAGIVDPQGRVLAKRLIATLPDRGGEAVLHDALGLAEALRDETRCQGWDLKALGVGVCELVDRQGRVASSHTLPWRDLAVRERFARLAPGILDADSRAAAFCEARCGTGQRFRSFLYVTLGTGIGSSLIVDGMPFLGANGCTGELASAPMQVLDPESGAFDQRRAGEGGFRPGIGGALQPPRSRTGSSCSGCAFRRRRE
jgi:glucokinase